MATEVKTMEIKKPQQVTKPVNTAAKDVSLKSTDWKNSLIEMKGEFGKMSWTSPEELRTYTKIVVAMTFFLGMGIYVMDLAIQFVLNCLSFLMRLVGG